MNLSSLSECLDPDESHVLRFAFYLFFFPTRVSTLGDKSNRALFVHCLSIVHGLKNNKNGSHNTIHIFKNYFTTVFSVFSFSKNKLYPNEP